MPQPEQLDTLRFASPGQTHLANVPVNAVVYETGDGGEAYHDLLFFKVQEDWPGLSAELPYFFPVADFANKPRTVSYIYGHPFSKNTISYDPIHAHVTTAFFDGKLDRSFQSDARFYRRYTYDQADYEVNGFSGGAVFSLIEEKDGWRVVLDGVILAAGNGFLHIVDSTFIHKALSKAK